MQRGKIITLEVQTVILYAASYFTMTDDERFYRGFKHFVLIFYVVDVFKRFLFFLQLFVPARRYASEGTLWP